MTTSVPMTGLQPSPFYPGKPKVAEALPLQSEVATSTRQSSRHHDVGVHARRAADLVVQGRVDTYDARTTEFALKQALLASQTAPQWETPEGDEKMRQIGNELQPAIRAALEDMPGQIPADEEALGSHYDFYEQLMKMLEGLQGEWLDRIQGVLEEFIAFFNKLNDIMSKIKDAIRGTNDKGEYIVEFSQIAGELMDLANSAADLGLGGNFASEAEARKFFDDMGSPEGMKVQFRDGKWEVAIDRAFILKIRESLYIVTDISAGFGGTITPARYQAIIAAKDGLMERFNHLSKVMTEKYQRTLQQWDTLVKALSSTIDSISEADRLFVSNLT